MIGVVRPGVPSGSEPFRPWARPRLHRLSSATPRPPSHRGAHVLADPREHRAMRGSFNSRSLPGKEADPEAVAAGGLSQAADPARSPRPEPQPRVAPAPLPALPPSAAPGGHASSLRHSLLVQARLRRPPGVAAGATPTPHVAPQSCSALRASSSSTNGRGHSVWPLRKRDCISKIHKGYSGNQYKNVNGLRIFLPRGRDTG